MLACGSVVAVGHDNDLRISDHIVTTIGRDLCPKCTKLMRWTNIRIYPHLHNLHITVDIVCPQLRKLNFNIPVWNWLINGWAWLSCNLLLSTSTLYSHDLSTFNTWSQAPGRLILPRATWPAVEFMTRMSWSSFMELNKCEKTAQNQTKTKTLGIFAIIYCYCRMDAYYCDHDVHQTYLTGSSLACIFQQGSTIETSAQVLLCSPPITKRAPARHSLWTWRGFRWC